MKLQVRMAGASMLGVFWGLFACNIAMAGAVSESDALRYRIDIDDLTQQDARIFLAAQHAAQRGGNLAGRQGACRDLVQQRLK